MAELTSKADPSAAENSFEEKLAVARSRDLLAVAETLGISIEKVGTTYRNAEHPSQVFYPSDHRFMWFSQDISGDGITLVQTMTGRDFKEAVEFLNTENLTESEVELQKVSKRPFHYYVRETSDSSLAKQYLLKERKVDPNIVQRLFAEGTLVQALYRPYSSDQRTLSPCLVAKWERQGELVGGTIQGLIIDEKHFGKRGRDKRIMGRSESHFGWNYTLGQPNKIIVAESVVDLLSYWSLHPELEDCYLVELEGLKENSLKEFIKELIVEKKGTIDQGLVLAVDNDTAGQIFIDKLSKYKFFEQKYFKLEQPMNNAILGEHYAFYQQVGQRYQVDPLALAAVHKAFTNGSATNQLANVWKNDQFFGNALKPTEKAKPINVLNECEKAAIGLQSIQSDFNHYDFIQLTTSTAHTPEEVSMGQKIKRMYQMYQHEGVQIVDEILKDQNDLLKNKSTQALKGVKEMVNTEEYFPKKIQQVLEKIQEEQKSFDSEVRRESSPISVYEVGQRQLIYSRYQQILQEMDKISPTDEDQFLVDRLKAVDHPLEESYLLVKKDPSLLDHVWQDRRLTDHFLQVTENKESRLLDALAQPLQEELILGIEALKKETLSVNGTEVSPIEKYSLDVHLQHLRSTFLEAGWIEGNHLGEKVEALSSTDWLKQVSIALTQLKEASVWEIAQQIIALDSYPLEETTAKDPAYERNLNDFKKWARDYDAIGKEYIPLEEIESLQLGQENQVLLGSIQFDNLDQYLETHQSDLFGQSVSYTNARLFLELMEDEYRELLVVRDQIQAYKKLSFADQQDLPKETREVFENFTITFANRSQSEREFDLIVGSKESDLVDEHSEVVIVCKNASGHERIFERFTDFTDYIERVDHAARKQMELSKKEESLQTDLNMLKKWTQEYEGRDQEYIPFEEIQKLSVETTEEKGVVLVEAVEDSFVRKYASLADYFDSFEGNIWADTHSFASAKNSFVHKDEAAYLRFELTKEKLLQIKEEKSAKTQEVSDAGVWENIHCVGEERFQKNPQQKLLFYQDPTRNGNPIYFDSFSEAERFVATQINESQKEQTPQKSFKNLFRRENKKLELPTQNKKDSEILKDHLPESIHPSIPSKAIEKNKVPAADLSMQSPVNNIGKTTSELVEAAKEGVKILLIRIDIKNTSES